MAWLTVDRFFGRERGQVVDAVQERRQTDHLVPNMTYFQVALVTMSIADDSRWLESVYPVVHAELSFGAIGAEKRTSVVVTPEVPGSVQRGRLGRVLLRSQRLTPVHVFRGGAIEIALGLYAAPGDDWAQRFMDLAKSVSEAASIAPVNAAMAVARPIKSAFDALLGRGKLTLELGLKIDLLSAGLDKFRQFLVVASDDLLETDRLSFDGTTVRDGGRQLGGADFLVLQVNVLQERGDLATLPIAAAAERAIATAAELLAKGGGNADAAVTEAYRRFVAQAFTDEQITYADRDRLIDGMRSRIKDLRDAFAASLTRGGVSAPAARVADLKQVQPQLFALALPPLASTEPGSFMDALTI
jgi:hypothetical protein